MKLNGKKGNRDLEWTITNKGGIFLLEEQHKNFVVAVTKWEMLAATNVVSDDEQMSGGEKKVNENMYNISSIKHVTNKFLEVSRCSRAKEQQRNVQKSLLHVQSCFVAN